MTVATPASPPIPTGPAGWDALELPPGTGTVVLIGAADGVAGLLRRHPDLRVLLLEPDHARADGCARRVPRPAADRLTVVAGPRYGGAAALAQRFRQLHTAPVFIAPRLAAPDAEPARAVREVWRRMAFESQSNDEARRLGEGRYLLQTLANGPRLAREADIASLDNLLTGIPAIVAAAGPSLDRNLADLAQVYDRAVVIACDTAARPILNRALEVDFIVATDSSRANAAHLSSLPPTRAWTIAEASLHPSALVHSDGRTFFFRVARHQPWPWLHTAGLDVATLDTWASVATSAFSMALRLGCNPIVFIGADFAFTGNRPYCRGTTFESLWGLWQGAGSTMEDVYAFLLSRWPPEFQPDLRGEDVRTARHLIAFRDWVAERAAAASDRQVVNGTGAGLLSGPAIAQQSAAAALRDRPVLDREALHARIRGTRQVDPARLTRWLAAATRLLSNLDPSPEAAAIWAVPGVPRHGIDAALRSPEFVGWSMALQLASAMETAS
jgi:hypothetical protein